MTTVTTLPTHRFTASDLAGMPDDGNRYELVDGALVVTPAPVPRHQRVSGRLFLALCAACPDGLEVFTAPFEVRLAPDAIVQPDLVVVEAGHAVGETTLHARLPFEVDVAPSDLTRQSGGRRPHAPGTLEA